MNNTGLSQGEVRNIIQKHLDKNADLVIGIDDPELTQLVTVLCDAIAIAIDQNNQQIQSQMRDAERNLGFRLR